MKILYGSKDTNIDITDFCYKNLSYNNQIVIPVSDNGRAHFFSDPLYGVLKKIFIKSVYGEFEIDNTKMIKINILTHQFTLIDEVDRNINEKLENIQKNLQIRYGDFTEELPEQKMAVRYLTGNEKVLELGSNIGRNSLIIASLLKEKNNNNFVTLECDSHISSQLQENRDLNHFNFHIETSALSKRKLIQRGWDTIESDVLLDGYKNVNTITLEELYSKYNIDFDTLVVDCEGAFYYILMDMPEILNNINLIIMENDYWDISKKEFVNKVLQENNFYIDYVETGGWGPCYKNFFEVWKKDV
jgi:FkbM family methyltransferase